MPASWNSPWVTSLKDLNAAPSSLRLLECGGMDPGQAHNHTEPHRAAQRRWNDDHGYDNNLRRTGEPLITVGFTNRGRTRRNATNVRMVATACNPKHGLFAALPKHRRDDGNVWKV
jgi:hypothetical protein